MLIGHSKITAYLFPQMAVMAPTPSRAPLVVTRCPERACITPLPRKATWQDMGVARTLGPTLRLRDTDRLLPDMAGRKGTTTRRPCLRPKGRLLPTIVLMLTPRPVQGEYLSRLEHGGRGDNYVLWCHSFRYPVGGAPPPPQSQHKQQQKPSFNNYYQQ